MTENTNNLKARQAIRLLRGETHLSPSRPPIPHHLRDSLLDALAQILNTVGVFLPPRVSDHGIDGVGNKLQNSTRLGLRLCVQLGCHIS